MKISQYITIVCFWVNPKKFLPFPKRQNILKSAKLIFSLGRIALLLFFIGGCPNCRRFICFFGVVRFCFSFLSLQCSSRHVTGQDMQTRQAEKARSSGWKLFVTYHRTRLYYTFIVHAPINCRSSRNGNQSDGRILFMTWRPFITSPLRIFNGLSTRFKLRHQRFFLELLGKLARRNDWFMVSKGNHPPIIGRVLEVVNCMA